MRYPLACRASLLASDPGSPGGLVVSPDGVPARVRADSTLGAVRRWRGLEQIPSGWGRCVVTIGVFDGVHRGHQRLIGYAVERARQRGLPCVLMTFDPHPAEVVRPGNHPAELTTLRRRAELVEQLGVDVFCVLPFTQELARTSPEQFVHELLVERLHAAVVVVGENFTFGHKASGDIELLTELGERFGFEVERSGLLAGPTERHQAVADGSEPEPDGLVTFSSTYIRACIDAGDVGAAAAALGRPHRLEGIVVRGFGRGGRELGFPTANLSTPPYTAIPADGVYACRFAHHPNRSGEVGDMLPAAVSIGSNPTFSGTERTVEAYVLDTNADFYGEQVRLDFVRRLREMVRFDSRAELIERMHQDIVETREAFHRGE